MLCEFDARLDMQSENGCMPVHSAASEGSGRCLDTIRTFHELGQDLQARNKFGHTAVHYAATKGHVDCLHLLAELGADIQACCNHEESPAHYAAKNGKQDFLEALHGLGCDLKVTNKSKETASHLAGADRAQECAAAHDVDVRPCFHAQRCNYAAARRLIPC